MCERPGSTTTATRAVFTRDWDSGLRGQRRQRRRYTAATSALALALAACAHLSCADETAIDLHLVPDPNINDAAALRARLTAVQVVLDAPSGLYPPSAVREAPPLRIADVDDDGHPELIVDFPLDGIGELPVVRIERGGLSDDVFPVEIRVEGFDPDRLAIAAGGVQGVSFADGQVKSIETPFNVKPLYRPPRVTQVLPEDGARGLRPEALSSAMVIFSKRMNRASIEAAGVFEVRQVVGEGEEKTVPAQQIIVRDLGATPTSPTTAEYVFADELAVGIYRVRVSSKATDQSGRALDQVAMQAGDQPFASQFQIGTDLVAPAQECHPSPCQTQWCVNGGLACGPGMTCNSDARRCEPKACPQACGVGLVCDAELSVCVPDCRPYGGFGGCAADATCGSDGLCR